MVKRVKLRHCAKFCGDRSNRCWDMAIFHALFLYRLQESFLKPR